MQRPCQHRQIVDSLVDAFYRRRVDPVLDHHGRHRPAGHNRLAHDGVLPECDATLRIDPCLDRMDVHRPIKPCAGVVLAAELQPHRRAATDRLRDVDGRDSEVTRPVGAPAKAAA